MKTLTCNELGGACETKLQGETFQAIGEQSKGHVMAMIQQGDVAHKEAMENMMKATPEAQQAMMAQYEAAFHSAPKA